MGSILRFIGTITVMGFASIAIAEDKQFGEWFTGQQLTGQGGFAATINDSGHILGQYCYPELSSCVYLLGIRTRCEKDSKYPVLVNSDKGSKTLELLCNGPLESGRYQYVFTSFDEIHKIVMEAYRVGFAFPLQSDDFIVVRFSLLGSNEAVAAMRADSANRMPVRRGTRDQRL